MHRDGRLFQDIMGFPFPSVFFRAFPDRNENWIGCIDLHDSGFPYNPPMPASGSVTVFRPGGRTPSHCAPSLLRRTLCRRRKARFWLRSATRVYSPTRPSSQGFRAGCATPGGAGLQRSMRCSRVPTVSRTPRESERGKIGGRTHEIQTADWPKFALGGGHAASGRAKL